jgi:small subunit ribosomal protein S16
VVVIRLNRGGSKKRPKYRITVADSRAWLGGRFLEVIGNFNPHPRGEEKKLVIDLAKANEWIKKGAQPTQRVKSLLRMAQSGQDKSQDKGQA